MLANILVDIGWIGCNFTASIFDDPLAVILPPFLRIDYPTRWVRYFR